MFLEQFGSAAIIFFVALVLTISYVLLRASRYHNGKQAEKAKRSLPQNTALHSSGGDPMHHLDSPPETAPGAVDSHDAAGELKARLEGKMRALQALIAEADRAAARLEAALKSEAQVSTPHAASRRSPLFNPQSGFFSKEENKS